MAVSMNNGTAPYKFQAIVGQVGARLVCDTAFSITLPAATKNYILVIEPNGPSTVSLWTTGTNLSSLDICGGPKHQRTVLSYVT
jgi:hypothetical protein